MAIGQVEKRLCSLYCLQQLTSQRQPAVLIKKMILKDYGFNSNIIWLVGDFPNNRQQCVKYNQTSQRVLS